MHRLLVVHGYWGRDGGPSGEGTCGWQWNVDDVDHAEMCVVKSLQEQGQTQQRGEDLLTRGHLSRWRGNSLIVDVLKCFTSYTSCNSTSH